MTRNAARSLIGLAILGLAFGAFGTWRALQPGADGTSQEMGAERLVLGLVSPAFAQGNQPPTAEAGFARTVAVGQTVVLDGSGSTEPEGKRVDFLWALVSVPAGSAAALDDSTAVRPSFVADLAGDYVVELVVTEGPRDSAPDTVIFSTTNSAPVADAGRDRAIALGQTLRLDGGASFDFDGDPLGYSWTLVARPAGSAATLDDPGAVQPGFVADVAGDYLAELSVGDGTLSSAVDSVTLSTANVAPLADAGLDQRAVVGQRVELDAGRASDAEGDELNIGWSLIRRPPGSAAKLSTPAADRPSFLADVPGLYMVQLDATDGPAAGAPETSVVTTGNTPPRADAGPDQAISAGQLVTLDGGASSDIDGDVLEYRWALIAAPAGSTATLDDTGSLRPGFTADLAGSYVAQLIVDDGSLPGRPDTVVVSTDNVVPVADAGPDQTVAAGGLAQLDGGGSFDADLDALTFQWSILVTPNGSSVALDDPSAIGPSFTLDKSGVYIVQLLVSDGQVESVPDGIVISTSNSRPVADAGPDQQVVRDVVIQLDGSAASDPDNDPLAHRWALLSRPAGSVAALSDPVAISPSFTADVLGAYVAQLIVSDGTLDSEPDTAVIEAINNAPFADAGPDQAVTAGDLVQLDGSGSSDPDLDPLTYSWSLVTQPAGSVAALSDPAAVNPTFVPDKPGGYVAELIVNDGLAPSAPDQVTITAANRPPVADAGPDQAVTAGNLVQLDGSGSFDADGDPIAYAWSLISKPADSTASLTDPSVVNPSFVTDAPGSYVAELIVDDGTAPSAPDLVTITANPVVGTNSPPILAAIGNLSVDLGATLTLDLAATDANGDVLAFSAAPLPLPAGAGLSGATGLFSFTPDATQVGDIALSFIVSDGLLTDSEAIIITVVGAPGGGVTALSGRLLDANDAAGGITTPMVGATVFLLNDTVTTVTDANGDFLLSGVPAGDQVLAIDSSTADLAPDGSKYASFREELTLISEVTNVIERAIYLPRIDPNGIAFYDATATTTTLVVNAPLGVTLEVPPDTAFEEDGVTEFNGEISISEVPLEFAPMPLPEELQPAMLISIQPTGVTFTEPLLITFPNLDNLPAGSEVDIYSLDAAIGSFVVVGVGTVSADGSQIETTSGGIIGASWHFPLPPTPGGDPGGNNPENQDPNKCVRCDSGSGTHISSGNLTEDHSLASYRSLNQPRSLRFIYNSTSADPRPVIVTDTTIPKRSAVPNTISTRLTVAGVDQGEELHTATTGLSESVDETIHQAVQFDASGFATGSYAYELAVTNHFDRSSVSAVQAGRVLVNNESASPFGAGWTLDGLERLHLQNNNARTVLTRGDGSALFFRNTAALDLIGSLSQIQAPTSVAIGALESDTEIRVFQERDNLTLSTAIDVDNITPQGAATQPVGWHDVAAGVRVNSYLIHFDPLGAPATAVTLSGSITFPSDILGVVFFDGTLDGSDAELGASPTLYPTGIAGRQVEIPDTVTLGADLRTLNFTLSSTALADQIRVITASQTETLVASGFDVDLEGWTIIDGGTGPFYEPTGGNPGGRMRIVDVLGSAPGWKAIAPAKFLGDQLASYGGLWTLDYLNAPASQTLSGDRDDLRIEGNGLILRYKWPYNPGSTFTRYAVPLIEGYWTDKATGLPPTKSAFQAVLSNLTRVWIHGDYVNGTDRGFLDNIAFERSSGLSPDENALVSPAGNFSTLVRNADDSFTRRLKGGTAIEYDDQGFMTARVDRNGNTTSYGYDGGGRLTTVTDSVGLVTTLAYTGGLLTSVTDPAGRATGFAHDGAGNLTQITDPDLSVRLFAYDARHRLESQTSKRGFASAYTYGFHGRNLRADRPDGSFVLTAPAEVVGLIDGSAGLGTPATPAPFIRPDAVAASFTDGNGNTTTFEVDKFGALTDRADALSRTTVNLRDDNSLVTQTTSPNGRVDQMTYDARGNLLGLTEAVGDPLLERTTTFEYETVFNQVTKVIDPRGNPTTFAYDVDGNLIETVDAALTRTTLAYADANCPGVVTGITRAATLTEETTTTSSYDPVTCNLTATIDDLGNSTTFAHDAAGNVVSATDALLRETRFEYDSLNRVTKSIDATNTDPAPACGTAGVTCFAYDAAGNLASLMDANDNVTDFTYDERERAIARTDPLFVAESFSYDGENNLRFATDRNGQTIEFQYDFADRLVKKIMQPGQPEEAVRDIAYDLVDNVISIVDPDSNLTFTHDLLDRVKTASTTGSPAQPAVTLTATYDANGNRLTLDDPVGQSVFIYDMLDRLTDLTTPSLPAQPVLYGYDPLSRRTGVSLPNGVDTTLTFDTASRLTDISHVLGGATTVSSFGYGHNAVNSRTSLTQARPSVIVTAALTYGYDDLDRLTQATHPQVAAPDETFGYDPLGNRLNRDGQVVDSVFDAANRLIEDQEFTYAYDLNGNLETKTAKVGGVVTIYTWDAEDRLARIDLPGGGFAEYLYDGLDRRIQKDMNGTITRYVYDGVDILLEYDGTNFLLARYTHGPGIDDAVMLERDLDASGTFEPGERFFYQTDGLGSVTELTDSTGAVARTLVYDSYGRITQDTGGVDSSFSFTGRELDPESGLYFYRARYYDAATGRFLSEDPIGFAARQANLYLYVAGNPINFTDPTGLAKCRCIWSGTVTRRAGIKICNYICTCTTTCGELTSFVITISTGSSSSTALCQGQWYDIVTSRSGATYFKFDTKSFFDRFLYPFGPSRDFMDAISEKLSE